MTKPAPDSFDDLKAAITAAYPDMPRQLQQIARYVLDHPDDAALSTVAAVAERVGVQPSSMVRFAKALGYDGYSTMQRVFRDRLVARQPSYPERIALMRPQDHGVDGLLSGFVDDGIAALDRLRASVRPQDLERAVRLLAEARDVYVVAMRRAFPVAFYLSYAFGRFGRRAFLVDGVGGLMREQAAGAGPEDLLLAISFNPYTEAVVEMVEERAAAGVPVIAITDSALSPIARPATLAFEIADPDARPFRSLVAPMCLAQALAIRLGEHLEESREAAPQRRARTLG